MMVLEDEMDLSTICYGSIKAPTEEWPSALKMLMSVSRKDVAPPNSSAVAFFLAYIATANVCTDLAAPFGLSTWPGHRTCALILSWPDSTTG